MYTIFIKQILETIIVLYILKIFLIFLKMKKLFNVHSKNCINLLHYNKTSIK